MMWEGANFWRIERDFSSSAKGEKQWGSEIMTALIHGTMSAIYGHERTGFIARVKKYL